MKVILSVATLSLVGISLIGCGSDSYIATIGEGEAGVIKVPDNASVEIVDGNVTSIKPVATNDASGDGNWIIECGNGSDCDFQITINSGNDESETSTDTDTTTTTTTTETSNEEDSTVYTADGNSSIY